MKSFVSIEQCVDCLSPEDLTWGHRVFDTDRNYSVKVTADVQPQKRNRKWKMECLVRTRRESARNNDNNRNEMNDEFDQFHCTWWSNRMLHLWVATCYKKNKYITITNSNGLQQQQQNTKWDEKVSDFYAIWIAWHINGVCKYSSLIGYSRHRRRVLRLHFTHIWPSYPNRCVSRRRWRRRRLYNLAFSSTYLPSFFSLSLFRLAVTAVVSHTNTHTSSQWHNI